MKYFLTASALLFSLVVAAQFPNLPYNPDENGDGLIGVVDLQGLLANYGNEFASAVVSEDGESAIVFMGEMWFPQCEYACEQLPGFWQMPKIGDLTPVLSEILWPSSGPQIQTWLHTQSESTTQLPYVNSGNTTTIETTNLPFVAPMRCYCAAKQLPRVEYDYCYGADGSNNYDTGTTTALNEVKVCVNEKLELGWQLLGTTQAVNSSYRHVQALWRWAE